MLALAEDRDQRESALDASVGNIRCKNSRREEKRDCQKQEPARSGGHTGSARVPRKKKICKPSGSLPHSPHQDGAKDLEPLDPSRRTGAIDDWRYAAVSRRASRIANS